MCKAFSSLMDLNYNKMHPAKVKAMLEEAMTHLKFTFELYTAQIKAGRLFCTSALGGRGLGS